jgi:hypothetical protein
MGLFQPSCQPPDPDTSPAPPVRPPWAHLAGDDGVDARPEAIIGVVAETPAAQPFGKDAARESCTAAAAPCHGTALGFDHPVEHRPGHCLPVAPGTTQGGRTALRDGRSPACAFSLDHDHII